MSSDSAFQQIVTVMDVSSKSFEKENAFISS